MGQRNLKAYRSLLTLFRAQTGLNRAEADKRLRELLGALAEMIASGEFVALPELGAWWFRERRERFVPERVFQIKGNERRAPAAHQAARVFLKFTPHKNLDLRLRELDPSKVRLLKTQNNAKGVKWKALKVSSDEFRVSNENQK